MSHVGRYVGLAIVNYEARVNTSGVEGGGANKRCFRFGSKQPPHSPCMGVWFRKFGTMINYTAGYNRTVFTWAWCPAFTPVCSPIYWNTMNAESFIYIYILYILRGIQDHHCRPTSQLAAAGTHPLITTPQGCWLTMVCVVDNDMLSLLFTLKCHFQSKIYRRL